MKCRAALPEMAILLCLQLLGSQPAQSGRDGSVTIAADFITRWFML